MGSNGPPGSCPPGNGRGRTNQASVLPARRRRTPPPAPGPPPPRRRGSLGHAVLHQIRLGAFSYLVLKNLQQPVSVDVALCGNRFHSNGILKIMFNIGKRFLQIIVRHGTVGMAAFGQSGRSCKAVCKKIQLGHFIKLGFFRRTQRGFG